MLASLEEDVGIGLFLTIPRKTHESCGVRDNTARAAQQTSGSTSTFQVMLVRDLDLDLSERQLFKRTETEAEVLMLSSNLVPFALADVIHPLKRHAEEHTWERNPDDGVEYLRPPPPPFCLASFRRLASQLQWLFFIGWEGGAQ